MGRINAGPLAKETIRPYRELVYIGQTVQAPSTVVAQSDVGRISVLTAFANPGMSLNHHLTEFVRPWLAANCGWVLHDRRLLLGTLEDVEPEVQWNFIQILESVLAGTWDPPAHSWEIRREAPRKAAR